MKRKNEKVPGFDEIIFENRNKEYGAYDLRKRYDSATSISILGGVALCSMLLAVFSISTEKGTASAEPNSGIIELSAPIIPEPVRPETKQPSVQPATMKNLQPEVTSDTALTLTPPPIMDDILKTTKNGDINDTIRYVETSDPIVPDEPLIYVNVKEMPEFPGGIPELMKFISENLSYPDEAIKNNIQGRVVLKFVVEADGSVGRIEIVGGIDPLLDQEAIRVVKSLPAFRPGKQDGVAVPVWFIIPVLFRLENN
jgi:protein TonB